ncbi:class I SAM-dependent methyltransferase [Nonlabens ponticola]|uniref:Class I SAM-dependent methyltransferase n=2 Tax=Nonlabens ponticola TaxID=2496866 RepID=A0A3S9N1W6_9FLAO|nr:class I SAM-dependent methyltransferase [Nonlabens ponticola]
MDDAQHSKTWYASWFNTPYYHMLYKDRDYQEAADFMQQLTDKLELTQGAKILDLACGRGRHSMYLNKLGYDVTGVDLSESSIAFAKARLKNIKEGHLELDEPDQSSLQLDRIKFAVHNMTVPYTDTFNAVFNLFTSFGYFDDPQDNQRTVSSIKKMLKLDGYGVIDFFNSHHVIEHLVPYNEKEVRGIMFKQSRRFEDGFIFKDIEFEDDGERYKFTERVSALTQEDFLNYLDTASLELVHTFGDYQLADFDQETSPRLILVFKIAVS